MIRTRWMVILTFLCFIFSPVSAHKAARIVRAVAQRARHSMRWMRRGKSRVVCNKRRKIKALRKREGVLRRRKKAIRLVVPAGQGVAGTVFMTHVAVLLDAALNAGVLIQFPLAGGLGVGLLNGAATSGGNMVEVVRSLDLLTRSELEIVRFQLAEYEKRAACQSKKQQK